MTTMILKYTFKFLWIVNAILIILCLLNLYSYNPNKLEAFVMGFLIGINLGMIALSFLNKWQTKQMAELIAGLNKRYNTMLSNNLK